MKKVSEIKMKNIVIFLGCLVFIIICAFLYQRSIFKDYYEVDSRIKSVEKSKKVEDYDTVGWLRVQGTNIDFPVVTSENNNNPYPVDPAGYGWVIKRDAKYDDVVNINGHNIFNLSSNPKKTAKEFTRFEELMSFVYYDFAKENKYIQYTHDGKDYVYKIFAVDFVPVVDMNLFLIDDGKYSKDSIKEQIDFYKKQSLYDYDVDVSQNDKIVSLTTCTRFFGEDNKYDFVVSGRLLRDNESMSDYNVVKNNDNYNKIEKIMKGDEINEEDV